MILMLSLNGPIDEVHASCVCEPWERTGERGGSIQRAKRLLRLDLEDGQMGELREMVLKLLEKAGVTPFETSDLAALSGHRDTSRASEFDRPTNLTAREVEVLKLSAKGQSYELIAESLSISINTVRYHMKRLHMKLNVHNRLAAIDRARSLGLI